MPYCRAWHRCGRRYREPGVARAGHGHGPSPGEPVAEILLPVGRDRDATASVDGGGVIDFSLDAGLTLREPLQPWPI
jgi:hypothetical protein